MMSWIQTYSGKVFDFEATDNVIDLVDITHPLSLCARFAGHTAEFYSVAQHSLLVATLVPRQYRLEALLHDASEAYTGDISTPLKRLLGTAFTDIEGRITQQVADEFDLSAFLPHEVKSADKHALAAECRYLLTHDPINDWHLEFEQDMPAASIIHGCPKFIEHIFHEAIVTELHKRGYYAGS